MSKLPAGILVAGALVLVAGCGGRAAPAAPAANPTLSTSASAPAAGGPAMAGPELPAGATVVSGARVNASALPSGFPREVWTTGNGATLNVYGEQGGCDTVSAKAVSQTDSQVTVRLTQVQQKPTAHHSVCPLYRMLKPLAMPLSAPLGSRAVVLQLQVQEG
jgi:hypothetical protein